MGTLAKGEPGLKAATEPPMAQTTTGRSAFVLPS
jgi:hypothetical protein